MKLYRLMILTASTGGGHDARSDALSAWAREIYGEEIEIKVLRPLESKGAVIGGFGVWLYNFIQRSIPWLHNLYFYVIELIGEVQGKRFLGRSAYEKALKEFQPQMVVSLHDFLNKGYFELAHEILGDNVKCATYCGEYSGGEGFSKHWVNPNVDRWVGRTEGALRQAYRYGMDPEKMSRFTFFVPPDESERIIPIPNRRAMRLDNKKLTILFASGKNGAVDHLRYLSALSPYKDKVQVIVVCGLNEALRRQVDLWQRETGFQGIVEGYSSRMRSHLEVSDVVMFRGGANTATRAFHDACPMWFDGSEGIMPQEHLTIDFFVKAGAGEVISSVKEFTFKIERELRGTPQLPALRLAMQNLREKYESPDPKAFFVEFFKWGFGQGHMAIPTETADERLF